MRDYFELQLRFAGQVAQLAGLDPLEAVGLYTNFHKRFGLGALGDGPVSPVWRDYLRGLEVLADVADQAALTEAVFVSRLPEILPPEQHGFGCFSCEAPDRAGPDGAGPDGAGPDGAGPDGAGPVGAGMVRIHFNNRDSADGVSPLSAAKIGARRAELGAMFAFLRQTFPQARRVRGGSWLYNLEAYRRLFPPVYGQSRRIPEGAVRYSGTSSWGQMLDFRGAVRPVARDHMLAHLPDLTLEALWRAFPLRALRASAPIEAFYDFYGEAGEPAAGQRVSDQ